MAHERMIRASEIGEYVYCQRAWWLEHIVGEEPADHQRRRRGEILHQQHGCTVWATQVLLLASIVMAGAALLLIAVG
jgi:hypothetical protein